MVERAESYPWSSARAHVNGQLDPLLDPGLPIIESIGNWAEWLAAEDLPDQLEAIRTATTRDFPLGEDSFVLELEARLGRPLTATKTRTKGRDARGGQTGCSSRFSSRRISSLSLRCHLSSAEGGTRTRMPRGATPSRWCVCQFHHFGYLRSLLLRLLLMARELLLCRRCRVPEPAVLLSLVPAAAAGGAVAPAAGVAAGAGCCRRLRGITEVPPGRVEIRSSAPAT